MIEIGGWQLSPSFGILLVAAAGLIAGLVLIAQRFRLAGYVLAALPPAIGIAMAVSTLGAPNGYLAGYGFATAWVFALLLALPSALLILIRKFRRAAVISCLSAAMMLACFYMTFGAGRVLGYGRWNNEMIRFGPDVLSSYVVVFEKYAEQEQINEFVENVLSTPDPRGGHAFRPGLRSLLAVSVEDHRAYALDWDQGAAPSDISDLKARINESPIVRRTFENIVPKDIKL